MDTMTQAQLYLADQRGRSQLDYFRSYHSFNFGQYLDENRKPFGVLQVLNDDALKAGHSIQMQVEQNTDVLIFPVVGGLEYKTSLENGFLEAGQAQILSLENGMSYEISNPYETELINFMQIWLLNRSSDFTPKIHQTGFDLTDKNKLHSIFLFNDKQISVDQHCIGFIGKYDGRNEGIYRLKNPENGIFVFILNGVFEVQNRLLHDRDGLALMNVQDQLVEFEALSNDAILLLMEIHV